MLAAGAVLIAAGMVIGAFTTAGSGYALAATWLTVTGLGMGLMLPDRDDRGDGRAVQANRPASGRPC